MSEGEFGNELRGCYASGDSAPCTTSDGEAGAKKKKSQLNDSCAAEGGLDMLDFKTRTNYLKQVDGPASSWNDNHASDVYRGFNVTKYIVENNFIFDPSRDQDFLLLDNVLFARPDKGREWLSVKEKLEETLGLFFVPGVEKMSDGLFDHDRFVKVDDLLQYQIDMAKYSKDEDVEVAQIFLQHFLTRFKKDVKESYASCQAEEQDKLKKDKGKKKPVPQLKKKIFEDYFEMLFIILSKFTRFNPNLKKSTSSDIKFTTSSLGVVCAEPDFIVVNCRGRVAAVVEVKPHDKQMFPLYRGHRMPGKRKRDAARGEAQGEVMETAQTSFPTRDEEGEDDMDVTYSGLGLEEEISEEQLMNDTFDENETKLETAKQEKLQEHIRYLEVKEKKQVRCFLPQLIAELFGSCKEVSLADCGYLNSLGTKRFGIGLVGIKARFVTMVIQDKSGKLENPHPAAIEKNKNISTKVFMTRELNLFKKSHLMMFFEILFAMGNI